MDGRDNYLRYLPEELIYTIYSYFTYGYLKNLNFNWCKLSFYKYGAFENEKINRDKYGNSSLCENILKMEDILGTENNEIQIRITGKVKYLNNTIQIATLNDRGPGLFKVHILIWYPSESLYEYDILSSIIASDKIIVNKHETPNLSTFSYFALSIKKDTLLFKMLQRNEII